MPYRFLKDFTGQYIDILGKSHQKTYKMNVRFLELNVKMNSQELRHELFNAGALKTIEFDEFSVSTVDLSTAFDIVEKDIRTNKSRRICSYIGQED